MIDSMTARLQRPARSVSHGTTPPYPAYDGDLFYHTGHHELYYWDSYRSKWLSVNTETFSSGIASSVTSGTVLKSEFGLVQSNASRGWIPPHDITIVGMYGMTKNTFTGNMTLREDATNTAVSLLFLGASEAGASTFDYDYDTTKRMSVVINITSGSPTNPVCRVYYKRRLV